jgi:hypothetical protein
LDARFGAEAAEAQLFLFDSDPRLSSPDGPFWRRRSKEERSACVHVPDKSASHAHTLQLRALCLRR